MLLFLDPLGVQHRSNDASGEIALHQIEELLSKPH